MLHALCLHFNMHVPVTLYIRFRLYFSGSNNLNVYSFDTCFERSLVVLLQYSHISYVLRKPKKRLSSRGGHAQCERDGSFVEK